MCMLQIAVGMKRLLERNITHRDLKAANVFVQAKKVRASLLDPMHSRDHILDPIHDRFKFEVVDFECSVAVAGTGFSRAPEICVLAVKNRDITPDLFAQASDMYSYGMTCYEILTGSIPFEVEGFKANEYDGVISGYSPSLPSQTPQWRKALLSTCLQESPSKRPTFEEIQQTLVANFWGLHIKQGSD